MTTSTCPNPQKYKHASQAAALAAIESLDSKGKGDQTIRPYKCRCGAWHIGHPGKGSLNTQIRNALVQGRRAARQARRGRKR